MNSDILIAPPLSSSLSDFSFVSYGPMPTGVAKLRLSYVLFFVGDFLYLHQVLETIFYSLSLSFICLTKSSPVNLD